MFSDEDLRGLKTSHNDVIVIFAIVVNFEMHKIVVDNKSIVDVLFYDTFEQMKLPMDRLVPVQYPLYNFNREAIISEGVITLPMTLGITPRHLNLKINFLVINVPSVYNMILSRPCMKMAKALLFTYHLVMKFPIKAGIGEVRGNHLRARDIIL